MYVFRPSELLNVRCSDFADRGEPTLDYRQFTEIALDGSHEFGQWTGFDQLDWIGLPQVDEYLIMWECMRNESDEQAI